ncbi:torsin-1A-interacting protein 2-like isoform X2 [Solea solea]|uniref:torsin-1A-interacting protein 2-like isoform X2 n=1 Tax=Solea solea TaxID=90069 RepID=UPI00272AC84C|nr:torsin-1A-interacting protein 2-like isoform X2 [Solea solea]
MQPEIPINKLIGQKKETETTGLPSQDDEANDQVDRHEASPTQESSAVEYTHVGAGGDLASSSASTIKERNSDNIEITEQADVKSSGSPEDEMPLTEGSPSHEDSKTTTQAKDSNDDGDHKRELTTKQPAMQPEISVNNLIGQKTETETTGLPSQDDEANDQVDRPEASPTQESSAVEYTNVGAGGDLASSSASTIKERNSDNIEITEQADVKSSGSPEDEMPLTEGSPPHEDSKTTSQAKDSNDDGDHKRELTTKQPAMQPEIPGNGRGPEPDPSEKEEEENVEKHEQRLNVQETTESPFTVVTRFLRGKVKFLIPVVLAIVAVLLMTPHQPESPPLMNNVDILLRQMEKVKTQFPHQRAELWKRSKIHLKRHLQTAQPTAPVNLILTAGLRGERTLHCLAQSLASAFSFAVNASVLHIDGARAASQDSDQVKLDIDSKLQGAFEGDKPVAVIHRFEELPPGSTLIFYRYCDHENAAYKGTVLIFTVLLEEEEIPGKISLNSVEEMVDDHLKKKFLSHSRPVSFDRMDLDKYGGLWSRISHLILPVAAEERIEYEGCWGI